MILACLNILQVMPKMRDAMEAHIVYILNFSIKSLKWLPPDVVFTAKTTKFDFGWGSAPDLAGET